jgi:regulator of replication initiation timing
MSKLSKKSLIASTIVGALALTASNIAAADVLQDLQKAEAQIFKASAKSQNKINNIYEQTQELLAEYRNVVDEADVLRGYNDHVQRMVDDQRANIASLEKQIAGIDKTKQGVVPLMYKMIDTLEKFVDLDVPMNIENRKERIAGLRNVMNDSNVSVSEQFRLVLEAYEIEAGYGSIFDAYQAELDLGDRTITADFVHMGRIALVAQSLDMKNAWVWNNDSRSWDQLGEEYIKSITDSIRMARKQLPMDLTKLPVFAAGAK